MHIFISVSPEDERPIFKLVGHWSSIGHGNGIFMQIANRRLSCYVRLYDGSPVYINWTSDEKIVCGAPFLPVGYCEHHDVIAHHPQYMATTCQIESTRGEIPNGCFINGHDNGTRDVGK